MFCQFLDHFTPKFTIIESNLTPHGYCQVTMPMEVRKNRRLLGQSVLWTVHGDAITVSLFVFLHRVTKVDCVVL